MSFDGKEKNKKKINKKNKAKAKLFLEFSY